MDISTFKPAFVYTIYIASTPANTRAVVSL